MISCFCGQRFFEANGWFACNSCHYSFGKEIGSDEYWNVWEHRKTGDGWDIFGLKSAEECREVAERRIKLRAFE